MAETGHINEQEFIREVRDLDEWDIFLTYVEEGTILIAEKPESNQALNDYLQGAWMRKSWRAMKYLMEREGFEGYFQRPDIRQQILEEALFMINREQDHGQKDGTLRQAQQAILYGLDLTVDDKDWKKLMELTDTIGRRYDWTGTSPQESRFYRFLPANYILQLYTQEGCDPARSLG
ncbi:MAG: hypothetical protein GXP63_01440 [DPANN group archaeon]|nr:hypothetical protein [DPANN group archaeon]